MQPDVAPRGRRVNRASEVLLFVQAHCDVVFAQRREDVLVEPALVPELDREAPLWGEEAEEAAQPLEILLHVRRQLEEDRAQSIAQHRGILQQEVEGARTLRLEPRMVRDAHTCPDRERELARDLPRPVLEHRLTGQPLERVIYLYCRKLAGVIA